MGERERERQTGRYREGKVVGKREGGGGSHTWGRGGLRERPDAEGILTTN